MKICYVGAYNSDHPRVYTSLLLNGYKEVEIIQINAIDMAIVFRIPFLIVKLLLIKGSVCYLVAPGNYYYLPFIWLCAKIKKVTILFDAFYSLYDNIVTDRQRAKPETIRAKMVNIIEKASLILADHVILDTQEHKEYFLDAHGEKFGSKISIIPITSLHFKKINNPVRIENKNSSHIVLYVGNFIPFHGIEHIVEAAEYLQEEDTSIAIILVGDGQLKPTIDREIVDRGLSNITIKDRVGFNEYGYLLEMASICLGVFGTSPKVSRVIPYKVIDAMAIGKPIITAESKSVERVLENGYSCLFCPPGDGERLAILIKKLIDDYDLRIRISNNALRVFQEIYSPEKILDRWLELIRIYC